MIRAMVDAKRLSRAEMEQRAADWRDRRRAQIDAEFASKLQLIAELWESETDHDDQGSARTSAKVAKPQQGERQPSAIDHVRKAIAGLPEHFTMPLIAEWLEENVPSASIRRAAISSCLNKLMKQQEITQTQKGKSKNEPAVWAIISKNGKHHVGQQLAGRMG
jgi:hypothetical protein